MRNIRSCRSGVRHKTFSLLRTELEILINGYHPASFLIWRGNMDIQPLFSCRSKCFSYVTKYLAKAESKSVLGESSKQRSKLTLYLSLCRPGSDDECDSTRAMETRERPALPSRNEHHGSLWSASRSLLLLLLGFLRLPQPPRT